MDPWVSNMYFSGLSWTPGKAYYWRVDTVTPRGVVKGTVWSFAVGGIKD